MKICPNCQFGELSTGDNCSCKTCGWECRRIDRVQDFLSNQQRQNAVSQDYNYNYEELAKKNIEKSNIDRTFLRRQAKLLTKYLDNFEGAKVCEIGIGQGFLCNELLKGGAGQVVAIDVAESYLKQFADNERVELYLANAETLPFENEFDLIVSTDVMEHVLNVGSFLFCVNRALVSGGRVAIRIPYREGLLNYAPHLGYKHRFGHLRSFNKDILRVYMKQAGFQVKKFHFDGYTMAPREWVKGAWRWNPAKLAGKVMLGLLRTYVETRYDHWSDVVNLPRPILNALLRPVEFVVVAEKVSDLPTANIHMGY